VRLLILFLPCLSLLAKYRPALASPLDMFGFGTRAIAMGGAMTGLADDYSAVYYNPAGMVYGEGSNLALGIMTAKTFFDLDLEPAPGISKRQARRLHEMENAMTDIEQLYGVYTGFTAKPNKYFAMGLLAYLPTDLMIRLHPIDSHFPSFIMYENRAKRTVTYLSLAVQPVAGFSFGGGVSIFANSKGTFTIPLEVKNRRVPPDENQPNEDLDVDADLTLDFPFSYSPYAGVMVRPTEWLRLGASYRGPFQWDVTVKLEGDLLLENYVVDIGELLDMMPELTPIKTVIEISAPGLGDQKLRIPVELGDLEGLVVLNAYAPVRMLADMADHWKPQEAAFGASAKITDSWLVSADVTWQQWSQYPAPDLTFKIDDLTVDLSTLPTTLQARVRTLTAPVLGTIGPLPPVRISIPGLHTRLTIKFPIQKSIKPKTHDIFIPRLGVEYQIPPAYGVPLIGQVKGFLRAGYSYQESPFEQQRGYINLVDSDKHLFNAGFGVLFNETISADVYGQCHYLEPIRTEKDFVDPDTPFTAVEAQGYVLSAGFSMSYHW
jgi:long-subunit fatty acid transport protein